MNITIEKEKYHYYILVLLKHTFISRLVASLVPAQMASLVPFMRATKALASRHICVGSTEPSLLGSEISTKISYAGSYGDFDPVYESNEGSNKSALLRRLA